MTSPSTGPMSITSILLHRSWFVPCGSVFVTISFSSALFVTLSSAFPLRIPCVTIAYTCDAPPSARCRAAKHSVPHVSAMSSTRIATLSFTCPTSTIRETELAFFRSLWNSAKSTPSRSAIDVALSHTPSANTPFTSSILTSSRPRHPATRSQSGSDQSASGYTGSRKAPHRAMSPISAIHTPHSRSHSRCRATKHTISFRRTLHDSSHSLVHWHIKEALNL